MIDEVKSIQRIWKAFKLCKYIGDIPINDEEYDLLLRVFRQNFNRIRELPDESTKIAVAVALVQIGLRFYDGNYWSNVKKELCLDFPPNRQEWIGTCFFKILLQYEKAHVDESEFVNNILLHCFVTNHYAADLFDFLFDYYRIDLDRDLNNNDRQMRDYLMQSMSKGEQTARAYKIKKHTADAVSANTRGCKIRVGHILRFMDNALFNDMYPINSQNRVAQLFCEWARSSDKFDVEKKRTIGVTHNGEKRFSTPYLHFDTKRECFCLILPPQYIRLDESEELPSIEWRIDVQDTSPQILSISSESCVTGCKTGKIEQVLSSESLLNEINIELWKNGSVRLKRFKIKSDCIRFFDSEWDLIDSATYINYLPIGKAFAFCSSTEVVLSDSNSIIDCEKKLGYDLYTLNLEKGDVLRFPDGKAKSVGKPLEEGVLSQNLVSGAYAVRDGEKFDVYNSIPSVYFRMTPKQENGTLIVINGEKHRFDFERCVRFEVDEKTEEKGYILKLNEYTDADGIYEIIIDVPNSRKERLYSFAFLSDFSYQFKNSPYLFQKEGQITFSNHEKIRSADSSSAKENSGFVFGIRSDLDELSFLYDSNGKTIPLRISVPALKWRFDDGEWNIDRPDEIWHKEFPKTIFVKYPDDEITFSMSPTMLETLEDDEEDESFSVTFKKNKDKNLFECDTRRMISWFGYEEIRRTLCLSFNDVQIPFVDVLLKNYIESCNIVRCDVFDCVTIHIYRKEETYLDILQGEKIAKEKAKAEEFNEFIIPSSKSRDYSVRLYTQATDEFGSEEEYELCDQKEYFFSSLGDLSKETIALCSACPQGMNNQAVRFSDGYFIDHIKQKSVNEYEGVLSSRKVFKLMNDIGNINSHDIAKVVITVLKNDHVKICPIDNRFVLYYGIITNSLYSMSAQMIICSANPREYVNLSEFEYRIKVGNTGNVVINRKYDWPIDKTTLKSSIKTKLSNAGLSTTDKVVAYGLDRLCTIPKIRKCDALDILNVLVDVGYRIESIDQIRLHYSDEAEDK